MSEIRQFISEHRLPLAFLGVGAVVAPCAIGYYFDQFVYRPEYLVTPASAGDFNDALKTIFPFNSDAQQRYMPQEGAHHKLQYKFGEGLAAEFANGFLSRGSFGVDVLTEEGVDIPPQSKLDNFLILVRNMVDNQTGFRRPIVSGHFGVDQELDLQNPFETRFQEGIANADLDEIYKMNTFWAAYTSRVMGNTQEPQIAIQVRQFGKYLFPVRVGIATYYAQKGLSYEDYLKAVKGREVKIQNRVVELDPLTEDRYNTFAAIVNGTLTMYESNQLLVELNDNSQSTKSAEEVAWYLGQLNVTDLYTRALLAERYARYGEAI